MVGLLASTKVVIRREILKTNGTVNCINLTGLAMILYGPTIQRKHAFSIFSGTQEEEIFKVVKQPGNRTPKCPHTKPVFSMATIESFNLPISEI